MPRKKAKTQAQPSVADEAPSSAEAPLVEETPAEVPLAEETPAEVPLAEETPAEVPLADEREDTEVDLAEPEPETEPVPPSAESPHAGDASRKHLRGLIEALVFASDKPLRTAEVAKLASAPSRQVKEFLLELSQEYAGRGIQLAEVAGGWVFRTHVAYAPFVRDLTGQKPVRLSRAQLETLAIVAYRQPVTRPEVDDIRGVDCGPVLKTLLERDLVRILGKKDEPGRPILYGTSTGFLELFNLKSLKDLPTLREFTELNEESKRVAERELGESLEERIGGAAEEASAVAPEESQEPAEPDTHAPETDQEADPGARPTLESAQAWSEAPDHDHGAADDSADEAPEDQAAVAKTYDPTDEEMFPDDEDDDEDEDDEEDDESAEDEDDEET